MKKVLMLFKVFFNKINNFFIFYNIGVMRGFDRR